MSPHCIFRITLTTFTFDSNPPQFIAMHWIAMFCFDPRPAQGVQMCFWQLYGRLTNQHNQFHSAHSFWKNRGSFRNVAIKQWSVKFNRDFSLCPGKLTKNTSTKSSVERVGWTLDRLKMWFSSLQVKRKRLIIWFPEYIIPKWHGQSWNKQTCDISIVYRMTVLISSHDKSQHIGSFLASLF